MKRKWDITIQFEIESEGENLPPALAKTKALVKEGFRALGETGVEIGFTGLMVREPGQSTPNPIDVDWANAKACGREQEIVSDKSGNVDSSELTGEQWEAKLANERDLERIENWFTYHPPVGDQAQRYERIRAAGKEMARALIELCPPGWDRDSAIAYIRGAVYAGNASIACGGK